MWKVLAKRTLNYKKDVLPGDDLMDTEKMGKMRRSSFEMEKRAIHGGLGSAATG